MTRKYLRQRDVDAIGRSLSDADRAIVATVANLRLVSARQLTRLHLDDPNSDSSIDSAIARRNRYRLARLVERDLLARLPRRVGGFQAGSAGYVYRLGATGHRLRTATGTRNKSWRPSEGFARHTLAISETYVILHELQDEGLLSLLRFEAEPDCWRPFTGSGGQAETLKPDAYVVIRSHGFEAHWYLEVDRGTESSPALRAKLDRYLRYFQAGLDQDRLGLFPQIRFVVTLSGTPSLQTEAERVAQIGTVIDQLPEPARRLFTVHALDELSDRVRAGPIT